MTQIKDGPGALAGAAEPLCKITSQSVLIRNHAPESRLRASLFYWHPEAHSVERFELVRAEAWS